MKGACPDCGFQGDLVAFVVDVEARQAIAEALRITPQIEPLTLRYLNLFRPQGRALSMGKATRLLAELADAIRAGHIERKGRTWIAPLEYWRAALEQMVEGRGKLRLPLKSHGYLYEIVAGLSDRSEAAAETRREQQNRRRGRDAQQGAPKTLLHDYVPR